MHLEHLEDLELLFSGQPPLPPRRGFLVDAVLLFEHLDHGHDGGLRQPHAAPDL